MTDFATKTERGDGDTLPLSSIARATHSVMRGPSVWQASETIITEKPYRDSNREHTEIKPSCWSEVKPLVSVPGFAVWNIRPHVKSLRDAHSWEQHRTRRRPAVPALAVTRTDGNAQESRWAIFLIPVCGRFTPTT